MHSWLHTFSPKFHNPPTVFNKGTCSCHIPVHKPCNVGQSSIDKCFQLRRPSRIRDKRRLSVAARIGDDSRLFRRALKVHDLKPQKTG